MVDLLMILFTILIISWDGERERKVFECLLMVPCSPSAYSGILWVGERCWWNVTIDVTGPNAILGKVILGMMARCLVIMLLFTIRLTICDDEKVTGVMVDRAPFVTIVITDLVRMTKK